MDALAARTALRGARGLAVRAARRHDFVGAAFCRMRKMGLGGGAGCLVAASALLRASSSSCAGVRLGARLARGSTKTALAFLARPPLAFAFALGFAFAMGGG